MLGGVISSLVVQLCPGTVLGPVHWITVCWRMLFVHRSCEFPHRHSFLFQRSPILFTHFLPTFHPLMWVCVSLFTILRVWLNSLILGIVGKQTLPQFATLVGLALSPCFSLVLVAFAKYTKNPVSWSRALYLSSTEVRRVLQSIALTALSASLAVLWKLKKGF